MLVVTEYTWTVNRASSFHLNLDISYTNTILRLMDMENEQSRVG